MDRKLRVGVIGAGTIAAYHLDAYRAEPRVELRAICDYRREAAEKLAREYGVCKVCADYKEILEDPQIDAVSIATPTFTHKQMVLDALAAGKHVLCEKPPARNLAEAEECCRAAEKSDRLLTYGFVVRFYNHMQYLKQQVDSGTMGEIYYANVNRISCCDNQGGWFMDKEKSGGGRLIDGAIHEIDSALYLMGYPKLKSVKGYTTKRNGDLPDRVYRNDPPVYRTVETTACALVTFENDACLCVKASSSLLTPEERITVELGGMKAGAAVQVLKGKLKMVSLNREDQLIPSEPVWEDQTKPFHRQIAHFVDCCLNGTECIVKPWQAVEVMRIISAIYESAETGEEIRF